MNRQLVNNVPQQTDLAARVALLEKRCDGLFSMVQALQAARGAELLEANKKAASHADYTMAGYDLNSPPEPQR